MHEFHFALTKGLWDHARWGFPAAPAPDGAELWAWIAEEADDGAGSGSAADWRAFAHFLGGTMCGSLNQMDATRTHQPTFIARGDGGRDHRRAFRARDGDAGGPGGAPRLRYRQARLLSRRCAKVSGFPMMIDGDDDRRLSDVHDSLVWLSFAPPLPRSLLRRTSRARPRAPRT